MTEEACQVTFAKAGALGDGAALLIDQEQPHCVCERFKVHPQAPCAVGEGEIVHRLVTAPASFNKKLTSLTNGLVSQAERSGMSCFAHSRTANGEVETLATEVYDSIKRRRLDDPRCGIVGVIAFRYEDIRAIADGEDRAGRRSYGVYATARSDVPNHLDVFGCMNDIALDDPLISQRRARLRNSATGHFQLANYREGLLLRFRPQEGGKAGPFEWEGRS